ncbi:macrophage-expressed gene 1 protein [Haliotis rufescens]|uniref:macrophage-expressed gene 1 protein n=1 Tax=Haliotis rufescens TaxID=6454 RepID=UPI00201EA3BE|nr:macrophage-expressed gene 1 protein [Haliotis rufescens]
MLCFVFGVSIVAGVIGGELLNTVQKPEFPKGDVRACYGDNKKLERFEVLPGQGWDNLRNVDAGLVVVYNYSRCRTTEDGRFLIPDTVNTIPLKASKLNVYAELISHWSNYTSTTAHGVNIDAGLKFGSVKVSGTFSSGYESVKSKQIGDKSYTTRVQLRYVRYSAKLQPDASLHPTFKSRLLSIAGSLQLNKTDQARYDSELLVRDFGTHVVTSVDAGAALVQEDQVSSEFVNSRKFTKNQITAGASASLFGIFSIDVSYHSSTSNEVKTAYEKSRSSSQIDTLGGPMFKASNFTANDWTNEVDHELVAVDRSGDPLFFLINSASLPELPNSVLYQLQTLVEETILHYYEFNTYRGCTELDSPNFSPAANLDDGTCKSPYTNLTFGGVYQTCSMSSGSNNGDLCSGLDQVNPKTGGHTCPDGYESVELHTGRLSDSKSVHSCHSCWLFFKCCHDNYYHSEATYIMHWCAATGPVSQDSGFLFGGLYTSQLNNPLTQGKTCPVNFYTRTLGKDLHICISDDYELGMKYSMPFGGFISCTTGNPLAMNPKPKSKGDMNSALPSLHSFFQGSKTWPKHCPKGYSQHLAYVDQGCEINYCLLAGSLSEVGLPKIRRPPFQTAPLLLPSTENHVVFDPVTLTWRKNQEAMQFINAHGGDATSSSTGSGMSAGAAAGIAVVTTLGCVVISTIIIVLIKRRRKSSAGYRHLAIDDPLLSSQSNYGATGSDAVNVNVE